MALQQQPSNSPLQIQMRPAFIIATILADACGASIWLFTRYRMGKHALGPAGLGAMVIIVLWAGLAPAPDMFLYWHFWVAMAIYRRITADPTQDTRFRGFVWMFSWCTKSEMSARLAEAALMPLIGDLIAAAVSEDIGHYITVVGTFSFAYRYALDAMTEARRAEAAHNAIREMEAMQRHFHQ